jgi:signal transduction histidine kinase
MTATNLASPPPIELPPAERNRGVHAPKSVGKNFRFGVAFRLLIVFATITAFAAVISAVALYTFGKYRDGFNRIASSSLPALVAASNLAQGSQAVAANAPNLAVAEGHFARRAMSETLNSQLDDIANAVAQIKALAPATEGLDVLTQSEASLKRDIEKLDTLVAEKIEVDRVAANLMVRLRSLSIRVRMANSELADKISVDQSAGAQAEAVSTWTAAVDEEIVILLSTSSADTNIRLDRLRLEFAEAESRAQKARVQFSPLVIQTAGPLDQVLERYGGGTPNGFDVRNAQLSAASSVRGALLDTKDASAQFVAAAKRVFADVQKDAGAQSEYFKTVISEYSRVFAALSVLCLVGAAAAFLYINRSAIQRLRTLSESMRVAVHGHTTPISITGNDEITEIAKAADFFVTSIKQREKGLQESLQQLRALGEVTQAVNSTIDLETVLTTIVAKATQLSDTDAGAIYVFDEAKQEFTLRATYGLAEPVVAEIRQSQIRLGQTAISEAVERRIPIQIPDIRDDPSATIDAIVRAGFRALLYVPLLGTDDIVGALIVRRKRPGEFPQSMVELLQTFAAQSVLAIQNAHLFDSVEARTRELSQSLDDLRTAQDRLVQTEKLASLGQLTAGIAHEIKNPLNFVNNFSALSTELIDEMTEVLEDPKLDENNRRKELDEIRELLKSNLEKVVQHGKRADSIVKNMLLHSRTGSGEHRPVDLNGIVEESLNLAYHGARAEKQGFNITLHRNLDPKAGQVDVYPQEMTRVLLNLISNGFYAATKRKSEADDGFEPTLSASTKDLGNKVEIRIRDNGTGIPADVKAKMFNPFFTTKPAGEGTGLGLSMSHDIVVKQHLGTLEVETEPGAFTEFIITLPRAAAALTS